MAAQDLVLLAPLAGRVVPLDQVADPMFALGMIGDGVAIEPETGEVFAPCAGVVVSVHSFTPLYKGFNRPWPVGILSNRDRRVAEAMLADLAAQNIADLGDNEPYAPGDGVYYTVGRHGEARGLPCVMIEVRNDEIADAAGESLWAARLARALRAALADLARSGGA